MRSGRFFCLAKAQPRNEIYHVCLDVFSRYLQVATLTSKSSLSSLKALKTMIESQQFKEVSRLFTDLGTELYSQQVKKYLSTKRLTLYSNYSRETKASLTERVVMIIKSEIYKYLTHNNILTYIDVLPTIVDTYNHSFHRGLGDPPRRVHQLREVQGRTQFRRMYLNQPRVKKPVSSNLAVGDIVRLQLLARSRFKFNKGYEVNNTDELFRIRRVDLSQK